MPPAAASQFGDTHSTPNGGSRFTFGASSSSLGVATATIGTQVEEGAKGVERGVAGAVGGAGLGRKVTPPRFAFGEQGRQSDVNDGGGSDGRGNNPAQEFMQQQREHRREQGGSEVNVDLSQANIMRVMAALSPLLLCGLLVVFSCSVT